MLEEMTIDKEKIRELREDSDGRPRTEIELRRTKRVPRTREEESINPAWQKSEKEKY